MATKTYTSSGSKASTEHKLPKEIFGQEVKDHQLLKEVYLAYLDNGRQNLAKTLKRGEVRGGGKKPWRQKGTGRARFGSSRNPIWRGGGVAFGPQGNENYTSKVSTKFKQKALCQALSLASTEGKLNIIETFKTDGKVKDTAILLKKMGVERKTLIVVSLLDDLVKRATDNMPQVKAVDAKKLTVNDVMDAHSIIMSKKSIDLLEQRLGGK